MRSRAVFGSLRIGALLAATAIAGVLGCQRGTSGKVSDRQSPPPRYNVLMVLVDALRADHLGCYGYGESISPRIDGLASQSLFYSRAYSNAASTVRSVASLFTSTLPFVHRISQPPGEKEALSVLPDRFVLMPEIFKAAGYRTMMATTTGWITPEVNYGQGVDEYLVVEREDAAVERAALELLRRQDKEPFFLYVHLLDLHDYYHADRLLAALGTEPPTPAIAALAKMGPSQAYDRRYHSPEELSTEDVRQLKLTYDRLLQETDQLIGRLADELEALGLRSQTLLVITSDHGEQFLEHGGLVHGADRFYNEVLHIPLIISNPTLFESRTVVDHPVSTIDILPTLLGLNGIEVPAELQGRVALRTDEAAVPVLSTNGRTWKVLAERWGYIYSRRHDREELYDLNSDPEERHDLAGSEPRRRRQMQTLLAGQIRAGRRHPYLTEIREIQTVKMSHEVNRTLRSLGYLD